MQTMSTFGSRTTARVCAAIMALSAATAQAQTVNLPVGATTQTISLELSRPGSVQGPEAGSLRIRDWRTAQPPLWLPSPGQSRVAPPVRLSQRRRAQRRSGAYRDAQRVMAAAAMGIVGMLAGAIAGGVLDGNSDDLHGMVVGVPIGGAVGATVGFLMVR